jgi:hypothetical protein
MFTGMAKKFFLVLLLTACNTREGESDVNGFGLQKTAFSSNIINVCWENRSQADVELRAARTELMTHISRQFGKTVVKLEGWTDCREPGSAKNEVRFTWWDKGEAPGIMVDGASQIGNGAIYGTRLKVLAQHIESKVRAAPTLALNSEAWREALTLRGRAVALSDMQSKLLHEFGHAVGLLHEHAREDSTCDKKERVEAHKAYWQKADAGLAAVMASIVRTKTFDDVSVMNYCHLDRLMGTGKTAELSAGDVQTINLLYAQQATGEPVP